MQVYLGHPPYFDLLALGTEMVILKILCDNKLLSIKTAYDYLSYNCKTSSTCKSSNLNKTEEKEETRVFSTNLFTPLH